MPTFIKKILSKILSGERYDRLRKWFWKFRKQGLIKTVRRKRRQWGNMINKFVTLRITYPRYYRRHCREPIDENKVLFLEPTNPFGDNFEYMCRILQENYDFDIHIHELSKPFVNRKEYDRRVRKMLADLATARYVFIDEASNVFAKISLRPETVIAQVWHACGAFKKFGFSTADLLFGTNRKDKETYPYYSCLSFVTVSSPEVTWAYSEAMGIPEEKILPIGVSRTDAFYDEEVLAAARRKFELYMPSAKGKKVILFAPTFRGSIGRARTATAFSVEMFWQELSEDYVLVLKHHPHVKNPPVIPEKFRSFAVDFTNVMSISELLCVADICISDYSSLIFEYSLFERPLLFFDYDIDEFYDWRGFYYNYDEMTPGPTFKTNREMIEYIKHIDERFDREVVHAFREKFMASCDGHSTERLFEKVFGEDLEKHRKKAGGDPVRVIYEDYEEEPEEAENAEDSPEEDAAESRPAGTALSFAESMKRETAGEGAIRTRLEQDFPQLAGKKIIAYFPTKREDQGYPPVSPFLRWQWCYEYLSEEYAILYWGGLTRSHPPAKYQRKRFVNVKKVLTEAELFRIADLVLCDFRYEVASYSLLHKPTFLFIPDYRWYCADTEDYEGSTQLLRERKLFYEDTEELIAAIEAQEWVDRTRATEDCVEACKKICDHQAMRR